MMTSEVKFGLLRRKNLKIMLIKTNIHLTLQNAQCTRGEKKTAPLIFDLQTVNRLIQIHRNVSSYSAF